MDRTSEIRKVLLITLLLNLLVSAAKVFYGYITNSISIFSDGFHSLFDGVSNIVGLIGIYIASHPPDEKHPYGHRKYETVFTIFVGILMLLICFEVFKRVYESLIGKHLTVVTTWSFFVMIITMGINIFVSIYEKQKGEKLNSEFLIADSRHTKSDIYVSIGVIISLVFIKLGFPIADPITGAIVGVFIAKAGIDIIRESAETLVDRTQMDMSIIKEIACKVDGVVECHEIRTRGTKSHIFIDLHVLVDPSLSVEDAHKIAV
ncbi:MAG: putative cation efflux system protein [Syntrophomonadaceae bacterium]|nr:putative cation efflux system protein [Bacillota bacterium]